MSTFGFYLFLAAVVGCAVLVYLGARKLRREALEAQAQPQPRHLASRDQSPDPDDRFDLWLDN